MQRYYFFVESKKPHKYLQNLHPVRNAILKYFYRYKSAYRNLKLEPYTTSCFDLAGGRASTLQEVRLQPCGRLKLNLAVGCEGQLRKVATCLFIVCSEKGIRLTRDMC